MQTKGIIFDLDDTLVDSSALRVFRNNRRWRDAVASLNKTTIFPGVRELLDILRERDIQWAIVTTSVSYYAEAMVRHHAMGHPPIVAYHDAPQKPSPAPTILALERLALPPDAVLGVGDSHSDRLSYEAAGVRSIGAGWSPIIEDVGWGAIVDSPSAIEELLLGP